MTLSHSGNCKSKEWCCVSKLCQAVHRRIPRLSNFSCSRRKHNLYKDAQLSIAKIVEKTEKKLRLMSRQSHRMSSQKKTHCDCEVDSILCSVCADVLCIDEGIGFGRTNVTVIIVRRCCSSSVHNGTSRSCRTTESVSHFGSKCCSLKAELCSQQLVKIMPQASLPLVKTVSQVFSVMSVVCWQVICLTVFRPSSLFLSLIHASCTYSLETLQQTENISIMLSRSSILPEALWYL